MFEGVFELPDTFYPVERSTVTNGDVTRVEFERGPHPLLRLLLIDCAEDEALRAVLVGMLGEIQKPRR